MISVIDASVAIKWFLDEPDSPAAKKVLNRISQKPRTFTVPELFYFEVYSVCVRRHPKPEAFANQGMSLLFRVPLTRVPMTEEIARGALSFIKQGLTGYDAAYAALARKVKGTWITFDKAAAKCLGEPDWIEVVE